MDGIGRPQDMTCVGSSHDGVLQEVKRLAVRVGTGVNQHPVAGERWHQSDDRGAFHVFQSAEFNQRGGDGGSGVTRADDGVGEAFLDQIDGARWSCLSFYGRRPGRSQPCRPLGRRAGSQAWAGIPWTRSSA
jgi:hypothetical protein